jgi:hypothetical protein
LGAEVTSTEVARKQLHRSVQKKRALPAKTGLDCWPTFAPDRKVPGAGFRLLHPQQVLLALARQNLIEHRSLLTVL